MGPLKDLNMAWSAQKAAVTVVTMTVWNWAAFLLQQSYAGFHHQQPLHLTKLNAKTLYPHAVAACPRLMNNYVSNSEQDHCSELVWHRWPSDNRHHEQPCKWTLRRSASNSHHEQLCKWPLRRSATVNLTSLAMWAMKASSSNNHHEQPYKWTLRIVSNSDLVLAMWAMKDSNSQCVTLCWMN